MYSPFPFWDSDRVPAEYMAEIYLPPALCWYRYQNRVLILCWKIVLKAIPWLRQLVVGISPRIPGFYLRPLYVGFVVDKLALGQGFHRVLRFSAVALTPRAPHTDIPLICYRRWGHAVAQLFETVAESRGFNSRWCHCNFHWHNPSGSTVALGSN